MPLSDLAIRRAKPTARPQKLADGGGLYLLVQPTGSRWWRFKYRVAGKEKLISLGTYPEVPLALARQRRDEARQLLAQGVDPSQQKSARALHKPRWSSAVPGYISEILTSKVPVAILVTLAACRVAYVGLGTDSSLRMVKDIHACDSSELSGRLDEYEMMKMVKKCNAIFGVHSKPAPAG